MKCSDIPDALFIAAVEATEPMTSGGAPVPAYDAGRPRGRAVAPSEEVECDRKPALVALAAPVLPPVRPGICHVPQCGDRARLYAAGWRCDAHSPGNWPR